MAEALQTLNALIARGMEFPDALYRACVDTGANSDELTDAYDAQFSRGS